MKNEPIDNCGCKLIRIESGLHIEECSLHKAAPDLLEACRLAYQELFDQYGYAKHPGVMNILASAISRAERTE